MQLQGIKRHGERERRAATRASRAENSWQSGDQRRAGYFQPTPSPPPSDTRRVFLLLAGKCTISRRCEQLEGARAGLAWGQGEGDVARGRRGRARVQARPAVCIPTEMEAH